MWSIELKIRFMDPIGLPMAHLAPPSQEQASWLLSVLDPIQAGPCSIVSGQGSRPSEAPNASKPEWSTTTRLCLHGSPQNRNYKIPQSKSFQRGRSKKSGSPEDNRPWTRAEIGKGTFNLIASLAIDRGHRFGLIRPHLKRDDPARREKLGQCIRNRAIGL